MLIYGYQLPYCLLLDLLHAYDIIYSLHVRLAGQSTVINPALHPRSSISSRWLSRAIDWPRKRVKTKENEGKVGQKQA